MESCKLAVLYDNKFHFNLKLPEELYTNKARSVLDFIKCWSREFPYPYNAKRMHITLRTPVSKLFFLSILPIAFA